MNLNPDEYEIMKEELLKALGSGQEKKYRFKTPEMARLYREKKHKDFEHKRTRRRIANTSRNRNRV